MKSPRRLLLAAAFCAFAILSVPAGASANSPWAPTITAPVSNAVTTGSLTVSWNEPVWSSINPEITLTSGTAWTKVTLNTSFADQGLHSVTLNLKALAVGGNISALTSGGGGSSSSLADGTYSITVTADDGGYGSYAPLTSDAVTGVKLDSVTQAATMTSPVAGTRYNAVPITYTLPEAPLAGSVKARFASIGPQCDITLPTPAANTSTSLTIDMANVTATGANSCGGSSIADGTYYVAIRYQDAAGNAAVTSSSVQIVVDKVTLTPTLTKPLAGGPGYSSSIDIQYSLPEAGSSGTLAFVSAGATRLITLASSGLTAGSHSVTISTAGPISAATTSGLFSAISGGSSIPDGTYTVQLTYTDTVGNPTASASASNVVIDTATQAPTLSSPTAGSISNSVAGTMSIGFTLPETAQANSVQVTLAGASTCTLTLTSSSTDSLTINLANPMSNGKVLSATGGTSIPDGVYSVTVSYKDALGNPRATSAAATNVVVDTATGAATFTSPASSTRSKTFPVSLTLPEAAKADSAVLHLSGAASRSIHLNSSLTSFSFNLGLVDPTVANASYVTSMSGGSGIPDGAYDVWFTYADANGNPEVSTSTHTGFTLDTTTTAPTLSNPIEASTAKSVNVDYTLPEAASSGSVKVKLAGAASRTVTLSETTSGAHSVTLDPADLAGSAGVSAVSGGNTLPSGSYSVTLEYQDDLGNPVAATGSRSFTLDTATLAPTLSSPSNSQAMPSDTAFVSYSLPETPLAHSVKVFLHPTAGSDGVDRTITLDATAQGDGAVAILRINPSGSRNVENASPATSIPAGIYDISVSYQDALGNKASRSTVATNVTLGAWPPALPKTTIGLGKPAGGKLRLKKNKGAIAVTLNGAGTVNLVATAAKGVKAATGSVKLTSAGRASAVLTLTPAGKKALKKAKKAGLSVTVTATSTATGHTAGKATLALKLFG